MKRRIIIGLMLCASFLGLRAQELNCNVKVVASQLPAENQKIMDDLQTNIFNFMNTKKWTGDVFQPQERIECTLLINVTKLLASDRFSGSITILASRPVYNSSYNSTTFNYVDKDFEFQYAQFQPLDYQENASLSNLTSVLAYYANIIIGMDYESFSPKGGQPFFQKALSIVNVCQNNSEEGWKSFQSAHNRYWLITNLLDSKYDNYRTVYYKYHREGMDNFYDKPDDARKAVTTCLGLINQLHDNYPNSMLEIIFFTAKSDELVKVYGGAPPQEKTAAVNLLQKIDPNNSQKYSGILTGK